MKKNIFYFSAIAFLLIGSIALFTACNDKDDEKNQKVLDVIITYNSSVITSTLNRPKGSNTQFEADVIVRDGVSKNVKWSVTGGVTGTTITPTGLLFIANNEVTNVELTITATSTINSSKSDSIKVRVLDSNAPAVTGVIISTQNNMARVRRNATLVFYSDVQVVNGASRDVNWSITSTGHHLSTALEPNPAVPEVPGSIRLFVHEDEPQTSITLKATPVEESFENMEVTRTVTIFTPRESDALFIIFSDGSHDCEFFEWNNAEDGTGTVGMITTQAQGKGIDGGYAMEIALVPMESGAGAGSYPWWGIEFSTLTSGIQPVDRSEVDALSLWIRSEGGDAIIGELGFGDGFDRLSLSDVVVTSNWENLIIPVPQKKTGTITQLISMNGGDIGGKKIYIDDIELIKLDITLDNIILPDVYDLTIDPPPDTTDAYELLQGAKIKLNFGENLSHTYTHGAGVYFSSWYNIDYSSGPGATITGSTIDPDELGGFFDLTIAFGGKTSNAMLVNVSSRPKILITDFDFITAAVGTAWPGGEVAGWFLGAGPNAGEPNILTGHDGSKAIVWHGANAGGWVRVNNIQPEPVNIGENNIITFYVYAVGGALGQPGILKLRHSGSGNDTGSNATNSHWLHFTFSETPGWNSYKVTIPNLTESNNVIRGVGIEMPARTVSGLAFSIALSEVTAR